MSPDRKLKVLFLCTGNSCRSQMAEGYARALKPGLIEARSAGVRPHGLDPRAVRVMAEDGVDISGQRSKDVSEVMGEDFDWVVTLCDSARANCPLFPGAVKRRHLDLVDPPLAAARATSPEEALIPYRQVRDEIKAFVQSLPGSLYEE